MRRWPWTGPLPRAWRTQVSIDLRMAVGNLEPDARALLAAVVARSGSGAGSEGADALADALAAPMLGALEHVRAVLTFLTHYIRLWDGFSGDELRRFAQSGASLGEIARVELVDVARGAATVRGVFGGPCESKADRASAVGAALCPIIGSAMQGVADAADGDSFAAEVGKASARVGAGVAALAQAMDCTMGVGMRGAALASSVKERLDGAPNLDAKVALLEGLNADVDSLLGGRCADALNTSVPDKLIAAGAITEAQRATVHTGAFAKVRSLVTFITDLSRVAMSGATFMDQTKAARATGASPRAKVAIGKAWDMLAAEGTRVLACRSKNGSPLAEAVPPSALGAVKTQAKIMCAAFKYGKPVANTLSNVGADSDMSVKALLVGELLSQTVENVIDGLSSQAVVLTAVVPRLASSVAQKGSSLARALRTLASPTKSGSITAILAELNARYIAPALEAARSTNDTALVAALADVSRLHRHAAVAGRAVGSEAALDVMATLHKEDREGEALAELESSMHPAFAASRAIVATVSVVDGITAAQCDTVVAKMGDEAPFTGAQLQAAVTASTELADALASSAVPLGHVLTAFVSGNPLLMMGTVAGMEAGTKLIAAQQPSPAEMKTSMKSAAFAHLVKGLEKLAAAVGRFTAAVEAGDGKEGAESDALAAVVAMCDNCAEFSSVVTLGNDAVAAEGEAAAGGDGDAENSEEEEEADTGASTHPVAVAESENTMVDVASAAHVVAYAQQVAVHAMEVSAQLTQALTPDDLSEAELDALDEEAAEEKAAAQDASIVDALGLKVEMLQKMAKLAGIAGSLAPQLGSAARRLAVEMRTASSLAPPSEVVQSVNGTLTAVSAIPAVADGAFTTAAAVLTFVSSMDETLKRPDAVRVMMKELDGLSEDLGSRIVAIRRARKPMTGRWATSVKFVEGFLVALEKTLVVVVKSQLTSPPTILVCKGGGAPLAASLTDDKIFSRSLNLLSVPIGPIPVFGVPLSVGLALMLDLEVGLETGTCQFTYMSGAEEHYTAIGLRTGATVAAEATVGLGSTGFSVGLGLKLALAGFTLAPQLDAQPATGNGVLTLTPYITSLQGQIFAFAKFLTYNFRASLYQWAGLRRRLPGPCKALHPEHFSTCPSIGPVGVPASGEEIMQELFASTARPKAVLPLSHVLTLVAKNGSGDAVTNPKEGSKGDRKGRSKDGGGKLGLLEEASGSEAKERLSGDAKSARTDRKRRGTKDLGSMMMADEVSGGVRVNAESMGVEGAGMGRDKRTEAEVLGEPTMMVEEGTTLMGDAEDVACTLCYVWSGSVYNSIWCPTPVMRMQYLAGLPNVGEMLEETMDAEGVVSRRLMSDRRRDSILAIGVCNERVQVKSGVPLTLDSKQLSSRTLVYTADVAVEWVAEARLGTEWFRLGYDSEAKLAVVESTDAPSGMASASRGVDAAVKSAFERQVARERRVRGVREAVGLGDAALTSMGVSLPSEVVDQALPMDDAHSPSTKQHVTVDPAVGWTTKRMTDEEEATANAELYVDPPSCGERLENARAKMAKAGKMGAAIAEGIVKMVFKECARDPSAAGASGAVSEEDRYAVSTRRCFRCNFVYDRYLACPLADSRGVAEVDAAKGKLGKRLSPAVSSSPFWEPAQRLLVAQRCLSAYFNRAPNGTESTEERVVRDTLRDVLAMEDSEKVAMAMHVYVCDERVTLDGNYDGWLMLHTSESHMLHFRVPAAAPTACSATLHTMKMVEEYPSLRDRAVAPMAEAAMADAAAVNLARQSCLPEPALPPAALSAALAHPTTDLRSVPSGWLNQSDEFVPSYNPRCLRCTVSSGASSVTCAPEEDERQLRLQTVMGPHAPGVDEEDAVERANRVLDEVAARALRQLVGKASLNDWTVAVCGESTWTMTRSASQANASGSGLSLVELGAKTSTKASTEAGAEVEGIRVRGKEHNTNFSVPNTCEFFCHWSTWKGNSRCGNGLHLDASQVPGCIVRTAGTQLAEPAVAAACKELNPECDSAYSEFSRAIVATSTRNSGPARECVFQCRQKSRVYETGDPCGQQVAVPESEAPGCTVLARDVLVPLTMPWAPKVAALCNAKSTLCDGTRVDYAGSKELTRESLARHEEMHKNKCIFSCKGCGFSVSVPEVLAPGCSDLDVGEQIENEALKRVCQQRTPPDQQCPKGNGVFVGMEDDTSADYVGGYICMGRRGQVTCGRYVADYAPLWPMYRDGQAKVHAEVVSASGTLHEPIYFAFDKLIAGVAYGDVEDTDYAVTDPCPRVPPPDDE